MALNSNVIIRNNPNKYLREEYFTKRLLYQDHIHIIVKYKFVQNVMTCSVVSHDFAICNQSKPLKIKVNHKFNFPTFKIENKLETISSSSSLIIATINCYFNFWSDETKIGLIPETFQNKTCAASPSVWVCRATC